ncbi:MAG TPA: FHA domain-containing protein, partial [Acidobacteria bacterium]|nr:FHA domain-containing protein [Acidobacteriota bacterium]
MDNVGDSAQGGNMVTLAVESRGGSELTYQLRKDTITIGASSNNDVVIRAPGVAPQHLVIQRSGDVFTFLTHPRQTVALNGERRSRGVLHVGDRVRIGTSIIAFQGLGSDGVEVVEQGEGAVEAQDVPQPERETPPVRQTDSKRAELVLRSEPHRLAEARRQMVEVFRSGLHTDLLSPLKAFFQTCFPDRQAMLAWIGENGRFEPIVSLWTSDLPRLPDRVFKEMAVGGRFADLHLGSQEILI